MTTAEFPTTFLPEAIEAIAAANRRLTRAGIAAQFAYEVATDFRSRRDQSATRDGIFYTEWTTLTLSHPDIAFGGWTFVGTLAFEDGGTVVRSPYGVDLSGWTRPAAQHCDHCHSNRRRTATYIVRHRDTGEINQIGSNCLSLFLGVKPSGLWALGWQVPEPKLGDDGDCDGPTGTGSHVPVRYALAVASVLTDDGRRYISRARAAEDERQTATVELVLDALVGGGANSEFVQWQRSTRAAADSYERDSAACLDAIVEAGLSVDATSDYGQNLHAVLRSEYVSIRNLGVTVSALAVFRRALADREARAVTASGYLAAVGEKITDLDAVITVSSEHVNYFGRAAKVSTLVVMRTDDGHLVKWSASGAIAFGRGDRVRIARATVKEHSEYDGTDQTVVTRAKLLTA